MEKTNNINPIKVSICISVHNTAKYLPRCLDSILAQTLKDIEIVLVNNGSTDNSEDIMRDYATKNPQVRFVVVVQEDKGLAQGRQSGINNAIGDYLAFLDADDYVMPTAYQELYELAKSTNSDIAEMQSKRGDAVISAPFTGVVLSKDVLEAYFSASCHIPQMLWLRIYKKHLFNKSVLPDLYVNNEDNFAFPCLLMQSNQVAYLKEPLHVYSTDNENAVMNQLGKPTKVHMEKFIDRKKMAIKSIPYVINFFGSKRSEFKNFDAYVASNIVEFMAENLYYFGIDDKKKYLVKIFGVDNFDILSEIVSKHLQPRNLLYKVVKIVGVEMACKIYCKIKY